MAKESTPLPEEAPVKPETIALDVWAAAKSRTLGRRVEGLAAFYKSAQKNGLGRATQEQFDTAFQKFMKSPA